MERYRSTECTATALQQQLSLDRASSAPSFSSSCAEKRTINRKDYSGRHAGPAQGFPVLRALVYKDGAAAFRLLSSSSSTYLDAFLREPVA